MYGMEIWWRFACELNRGLRTEWSKSWCIKRVYYEGGFTYAIPFNIYPTRYAIYAAIPPTTRVSTIVRKTDCLFTFPRMYPESTKAIVVAIIDCRNCSLGVDVDSAIRPYKKGISGIVPTTINEKNVTSADESAFVSS